VKRMKVNREFVIIFFIKMCIRTSPIFGFLQFASQKQYGILTTDHFLFPQIVDLINLDVFQVSNSEILVKDGGTE
jgi:hypothetical protein